MIKAIRVINKTNKSSQPEINIVLDNPYKSHGFAITGITGLGPGSATVNSTDIVTIDGQITNSVRLSSRTIQMTMLLLDAHDGDYINDVETIRRETYKYFPIKGTVRLEIEFDNMIELKSNNGSTVKVPQKYTIEGIVSKNEPDIFSEQCGASIEIKCDDPYFYDYYVVGDNTSGNISLFHSNSKQINSDKKLKVYSRKGDMSSPIGMISGDVSVSKIIKMKSGMYGKLSSGDLVDITDTSMVVDYIQGFPNEGLKFPISNGIRTNYITIDNESTETIGFTMEISFFAPSGKSITIVNHTTNEMMVFNQGLNIKKGDVLSLCTVPGKKKVTINGENSVDIIDLENTKWLNIVPGYNRLEVILETPAYYSTTKIDFSCRYMYEGV